MPRAQSFASIFLLKTKGMFRFGGAFLEKTPQTKHSEAFFNKKNDGRTEAWGPVRPRICHTFFLWVEFSGQPHFCVFEQWHEPHEPEQLQSPEADFLKDLKISQTARAATIRMSKVSIKFSSLRNQFCTYLKESSKLIDYEGCRIRQKQQGEHLGEHGLP